MEIQIIPASVEDAAQIADIHLAARQEAMPYLHKAHTDDEVRDYFLRSITNKSEGWFIAQRDEQTVGFVAVNDEWIDHLYVMPGKQGMGVGSAILRKAKEVSLGKLKLWAFQRNLKARGFYQANGFVEGVMTDGDNEEKEPDVQLVWKDGS